MIRRPLAFALTFLAFSSPAFADPDIDVTPSRDIARLEATDQERPGEAKKDAQTSSARVERTEIVECDQAPGARAANFSCALTEFPGTFSPLPMDVDSTPGDIRRAIREVPMPPLDLQIQPDGETLVNIETIFYTDPAVLRRTVTLLGHSVRLECTPVRFTWVHGDGTTASTSKPGRPYPAKDVTHRYEQPGDNLGARVDTTYRVRYSVDGGGWATLDETLTARGPVTTIDVDEAVPVLTR